MSDLMLKAVLRMPYEMAMADELSRRQFYDRAQQAINLAESLAEHDNEVIESCAKAVDEMVVVYSKNCERYKSTGEQEDVERNVNKGRAAISCAEVIRALKEVK